MQTIDTRSKLTLSFDIGHSSIGWSVFSTDAEFPNLLGAGTVLFPKDSCLANARRENRRTRRNIAARRSRVERLKKYFESLGVLSREDLNENSTSSPWFSASCVLASGGKEKLSWKELWAVVRWYAHNRGYDGNALWAGDGASAEEKEDTEKVKAANALMEKYNTGTAAETICAFLGLNPAGEKRSSRKYFKGQNVAFPRDVVVAEVRKILEAHKGVLPKLDDKCIRVLLKDATEQSFVKLPARFRGGLLFGQYVPRFNNRIIGKCRITGKNTPLKSCKEFLLYRWGRLLNNLTVMDLAKGIRVLEPAERKALHAEMLERGFFDKKSINEALTRITHCEPANTESYFLTEEMEEALVLDPVKKYLASKKDKDLKELLPLFSEQGQKIFATKLSRRKTIRLCDFIEKMKKLGGWDSSALEAKIAELQSKKDKKGNVNKILNKPFSVAFPDGRAPYSKEILKKAFEESLRGNDPTMEGWCLYETPEIRERLLGMSLAEQTNNHMVRHRLMIFDRLLDDIVSEYADGNAERIGDVIVEVVKELKEFSGCSSKDLGAKENEKMKNFRMVSEKLEKDAAVLGVPVTGSLIRKARLLEDQDFTDPYTNAKKFSNNELLSNQLEIEHIIPRSLRLSDALDSCVMTFKAVNDMKGQRTAMQFIKECEGQNVPGTNLTVSTLKDFEKWCEAHGKKKLGRGYGEEDIKRCERRAKLLLLEKYEERNADFTNRDLTQTSYLNKMAIRLVEQKFKGVKARHLPGVITGFVRKKMNIADALISAVPRMQKKASEGKREGKEITKTEMRNLTHLHHAMDAITQALTGIFFRTEDWKTLAQRRIGKFDRERLGNRYSKILKFSSDGEVSMSELPKTLRENIRQRLEECRVVQHVPARMNGMVVDQTTWSVEKFDEDTGKVKLSQKQRDKDSRRIPPKPAEKKPSKLLGYGVPAGKLKSIKGVVQISENWGCVLDPEPCIIPYFKVFPKLRELIAKNGGKRVRILRNGMLISVPAGAYRGMWIVRSVKDNTGGIAVDMTAVDKVNVEKVRTADSKVNVILSVLLKNGLKIEKTKLTGIPQCRSTLLQ